MAYLILGDPNLWYRRPPQRGNDYLQCVLDKLARGFAHARRDKLRPILIGHLSARFDGRSILVDLVKQLLAQGVHTFNKDDQGIILQEIERRCARPDRAELKPLLIDLWQRPA